MSEQGSAPAIDALFDKPADKAEPSAADTDSRSRIDALIDAKPEPKKEPEPKKAPEPEKEQAEPAETLGLADDDLDQLGDDETSIDDDKGDESLEDEALPETMDAKALAEKLGIDVKDLYEMKFPYGENGEAISLGELKDVGIRARTIDDEAERLSIDRDSYVNEQMKSRNELQQIVSLLPEVPPGLRDAALRQHDVVRQRERVSMLETVPEWRDPGKEQEAMNAISGTLSEYGYSQTEMSYMLDHRLIKLFHDFTRLKGKLIKPRAAMQVVKKKAGAQKRGKQRGKDKRESANQIASTGNTLGAIDKLFE